MKKKLIFSYYVSKGIEILKHGFELGKILYSCGNLNENILKKNITYIFLNIRISDKNLM